MRPPSNLAAYFADVTRYPLLSEEAELELVIASAAGDEDARKKLICHNLRLVISFAKKFVHFHRYMPLEDAIQEGNIGLVKGAERFDPDVGVRFSTYATWWVRSHIQIGARSYRLIYLPPCASTAKSLAVRRAAKNAKRVFEVDAIEGTRGSAWDLIGGTYVDAGIEDLGDRPDLEPIRLLAKLNPRARRVIEGRFGIGCQRRLLSELGSELGLTKERIRQIETKAISELREAVAS